MGGWHRIFVVFCVVTALFGLAAAWASKPEVRRSNDVYACQLTDASIDPGTARWILSRSRVPASLTYTGEDEEISADCYDRLQRVQNGTAHSYSISRWQREVAMGAAWLAAFWALVYASGWSLGWIWRGFRRKP